MFLVDRVYIVHTGRRSPSYVMRRQHVMTPVSRESRRIVNYDQTIYRNHSKRVKVVSGFFVCFRPARVLEALCSLVVSPSVRPFVSKLVNTIFWKQMNDFDVVYGTSRKRPFVGGLCAETKQLFVRNSKTNWSWRDTFTSSMAKFRPATLGPEKRSIIFYRLLLTSVTVRCPVRGMPYQSGLALEIRAVWRVWLRRLRIWQLCQQCLQYLCPLWVFTTFDT